MIDVARLGHADDGVDQQVGLDVARGPQRQLLMRPVHRVSRLECDDLAPAELTEAIADFIGSIPKMLEIVVGWRLDTAKPAADIDWIADIEQVIHTRVLVIGGPEDRRSFRHQIGLPDVADFECGDDDPLEVAQCQPLSGLQLVGERLAYVQCDRDRPEQAAAESHIGDNGVVIGLREKTLERRERAVQKQLDVAELPFGQVPRLEVAGSLLLGLGLTRRQIQLLERAAVRFLECSHRSSVLK